MDRGEMLVKHHGKTLWVWWTVILLGVWVLVSPLTFGYGTGVVDPSGGRELWLTTSARVAAMKWSDVATGALLAFFGWRSLTPNRPVSMWICCLLGCWLTFAPVLFWAPTAAAYMNDTIVGMLVISLTILVPGMPNMVAFMKMGGGNEVLAGMREQGFPTRGQVAFVVLETNGKIIAVGKQASALGGAPGESTL